VSEEPTIVAVGNEAGQQKLFFRPQIEDSLRVPVLLEQSPFIPSVRSILFSGSPMTEPGPVPPPRFDSLEQEAYLNLWRTYDRLRALEDELFGRYGITAQQYNALRLLREVVPQGLPTLALAKKLISRAPDITRLLNKLVEGKFIERERKDSNRRVDPLVTAANSRQLGHLSERELHSLIEALRKARRPHE
jgi:DNA-binding MarR family transcriptional regulator